MAGSDEKEQLTANETGAGGPAPLALQDPDVSGFIMPGLPVGLIPRADLDRGVSTTIQSWPNPPPDGETDYFRLQIARAQSNEWSTVQEHSFSGGDTWVPLVFTIPSSYLLDPEHEGAFDLRYEHENFLETLDHSGRAYIHIDKLPPNGVIPPNKMVFALTPPITDATFGANDYLEATIPPWTGDQTAVQVAFGWIKGELPEDPDDIDLIGPQPIAAGGGTVQITKDKFAAAGDGRCCGGYVLIDKAGNISALSRYELMSVALDPLPITPLIKPTAADATGGELLRSDIVHGNVLVNVPRVSNGKSTDTVVVKWGSREITPGTPVGSNPSGGINIPVPWSVIWAEYGSATIGGVDTDLSYTVLRGVEPFGSALETVRVNLSTTGPVNPDPEPGNGLLKVVTVVGDSGVDNELVDTDEDQEVFAKIELVAPLVDGDTYQVLWNGTPIGAPYVIDVTNDAAGDEIEIELDWDVIRGEGPSATMPVWYVLTNAAHQNPEEPAQRTSVKIDFLVFDLPQAIPQHTNTAGILTCNSLRWDATGTEYGMEYLIPPSSYLKPGDDVVVEWKAYTDHSNPVEIPSAAKTHTFTNITQAQADNGIVWLIEPYDTHILPLWQSASVLGKGEVSYRITGKPYRETPTNTRVGLAQGEGSCEVPDRP
ncbi:hypothetical protein [Pseudomonas sp. St316]|uniref:hypothetical protein n=1 Tax=Pseudomonas sp. St316 TaxID=2678257 RepID=UPI001BB31949|nr:hypothetical protein [Pseudomonas sp. St316]BBP57876.1 hypothetical protein PHLH4_14660 [Pseudomonas sp. St316]